MGFETCLDCGAENADWRSRCEKCGKVMRAPPTASRAYESKPVPADAMRSVAPGPSPGRRYKISHLSIALALGLAAGWLARSGEAEELRWCRASEARASVMTTCIRTLAESIDRSPATLADARNALTRAASKADDCYRGR